MSSFAIQEPSEFVDLRAYSEEVLMYLASHGRIVYWDRDGQINKIPNAVLRDVLRRLNDFQSYKALHEDAIPWARLGLVEWDQTVPIKSEVGLGAIQPLPPRQLPQPPSPSTKSD